jgi:hypothetical protein
MKTTPWTGANDMLGFIRQHKNKNHIEIEFRLGKKNGNVFDTNVGKKVYEDALHSLKQYRGWENVTERRQTVYYGNRKGLRVVYNEDTDEQDCTIKHRAAILDQVLDGWPVDLRIAASIEIPTVYDQERDRFLETKSRIRTSFTRKGLVIDVSEITSASTRDKDQENSVEYQIEFEIIDPANLDSDSATFNHYHKVFDLLKCLFFTGT